MADVANVTDGAGDVRPTSETGPATTAAMEATQTGHKRKRSASTPNEDKKLAAKIIDIDKKPKIQSSSPILAKPGTEALPFEIIDSPPASPPSPAVSRHPTKGTRTAVATSAPPPARAASMSSTASARPALPTPTSTPGPAANTANVDDDAGHATSEWRDRMEIMLMRKELEYQKKHGKRLEWTTIRQ
nr:hypothetical protein B0A51_08859 [Rachicladosporium sp. CCFEE 5018]